MTNDEAKDKFSMAVSSFEARRCRKLDDEGVDDVHTRHGIIPASVEVKVVRCPFEDSIMASEVDMPLCKHAEDCVLEDALDLCPVPHLHNFESPGPRMQFESRTVTDGFSLQEALARVARKTKTVREMKKAGKKIVRPKEIRRVLDTSTRPYKMKTSTRAEAYSLYEFDTTPPEVEKTEIITTRRERWKAADEKERLRLRIIQDSRDLKIQRMLELC